VVQLRVLSITAHHLLSFPETVLDACAGRKGAPIGDGVAGERAGNAPIDHAAA
jgi:hypothetical protein